MLGLQYIHVIFIQYVYSIDKTSLLLHMGRLVKKDGKKRTKNRQNTNGDMCPAAKRPLLREVVSYWEPRFIKSSFYRHSDFGAYLVGYSKISTHFWCFPWYRRGVWWCKLPKSGKVHRDCRNTNLLKNQVSVHIVKCSVPSTISISEIMHQLDNKLNYYSHTKLYKPPKPNEALNWPMFLSISKLHPCNQHLFAPPRFYLLLWSLFIHVRVHPNYLWSQTYIPTPDSD